MAVSGDIGTRDNGDAGDGVRRAMDELDPNIRRVFLPWALRHPRHLLRMPGLARSWKRTQAVRRGWREKGVLVPSVLIMSVTPECNLSCPGCYAAAAGNVGGGGRRGPPLTVHQWRAVIDEACDLGVYCFVLAGGEPFLLDGLLSVPEERPDRMFMLFTNGTAVEEGHVGRLSRLSNTATFVSVEGSREMTDARRGPGVHDAAVGTLRRLTAGGAFCGISVTITRHNFHYWMERASLEPYLSMGVRAGVFIEYIPTTPCSGRAMGPGSCSDGAKGTGPRSNGAKGTGPCSGGAIPVPCPPVAPDASPVRGGDDHGLMLTPEERSDFRERILEYRRDEPMYVIHSPGDEEVFGGCVSAGRGFAHITPRGDLTPCPVSGIATHNALDEGGLLGGLSGELFRRIRADEHLLETDGMPCALFAHPEEVDELARRVGAYRTD